MAEEVKQGERIAKAIARAGVCSRREAERLIAEGAVTLNGERLATPARVVTGADRITVNGKPLPQPAALRLWRYHKPAGLVVSHRDPQGRPTVFDAVRDRLGRVVSVGRLDLTTEGLLLLTNDGAFARHLELPASGWLRRYRVRAHGRVACERLLALKDGVTIEGIHYGPVEAAIERQQTSNVWLTIGIREGKNREVRIILEHLGLAVNRLIRTHFGPFELASLERGAIAEVPPRQARDLTGYRGAGADADRRR